MVRLPTNGAGTPKTGYCPPPAWIPNSKRNKKRRGAYPIGSRAQLVSWRHNRCDMRPRRPPVSEPSREPLAPDPTARRPRLTRLGDLLGEWEADALATHTAHTEGRPRGPVTGFDTLDRELGGALAPGLHVLHGQPGAGKTAFALQVAATCACPALYVSAEMAPLELLRRVAARATSTFLGRLRTGELTPLDSLALARRAVAAAPQLIIADATQAFADPAWLRDAALATRGEAEHLLVAVDSVHSWAEAAPGDADEYTRLNAALATLQALAGALGCAVLAVAERNRASMKAGGLSAGAGTRKLEYRGETVLDLKRDPDAREDASGELPVTVELAKNRSGAAGRKVELHFHGALQRFRVA
jgi:replicative DNA helicase